MEHKTTRTNAGTRLLVRDGNMAYSSLCWCQVYQFLVENDPEY